MSSQQRRFLIFIAVLFVLLTLYFFLGTGAPGQKGQRPQDATTGSTPFAAYLFPDPQRTPGAINPDITHDNIGETICSHDWSTSQIRPPASYTKRMKEQQIREWGLPGNDSDYEEDHLISVELGGHPADPRNLWPEPYSAGPGAREKDVMERRLRNRVCSGEMTLETAQRLIATDWYRIYLQGRK